MTDIDKFVATVREGLLFQNARAAQALDRLAATAREYDEDRHIAMGAAYRFREQGIKDAERAETAEADRDRLARRVEQLETALRWMADYNLIGTEQTLHIDFQGKARAALSSQPTEPQETA